MTQQLALVCYQIVLPYRIYCVWFPVQRLTDTWVVPFSGTLWLMPPPTFVHRLLRAHVKACPLGMYFGTRLQGHIGPACFLCSETTGASLRPCGHTISAPSGSVTVPLLHTLDDTGHFPCSGTSGPRGHSSVARFSVSWGRCLWATSTSSLVTLLF